MFATLSGRIHPPGGCLEIKCLFEPAERPQTTKRFLEPRQNRTRWPGRRSSTPGVTTLREIQTIRTSPPFPRASYVRKGFNFSRATRKVTVLGLAMVFFSLNFYCNDLELTIALIQSNVEPGDVPLIGARETTPVVAAVSQRETVVTAH